jgi:hypothetical protein
LSLQESECAEALHQAAVDPEVRPAQAEGLMKWLAEPGTVAGFLNDGWYSNTLALVRAPPTAEGHRALVCALFPKSEADDGLHMTIGGFASKSLLRTGIQALVSMCRSWDIRGIDLSGALADGAPGAREVASALPVQLSCTQHQHPHSPLLSHFHNLHSTLD